MDLHLFRSDILRYWAGTPDQHRKTNRLYRRMRIEAAQRELSRNNGERFLTPGYACVPRADWLRRYHDAVLTKGAHLWYKGDDGLWWLGKISASTTEDKIYLASFRATRNRLNFLFPGALHDLDGSSTRLLLLPSLHFQWLSSQNST